MRLTLGLLADAANGWTEYGVGSSHRTWRSVDRRRLPLVDAGGGPVLPVSVKRAAAAILKGGGCDEHK